MMAASRFKYLFLKGIYMPQEHGTNPFVHPASTTQPNGCISSSVSRKRIMSVTYHRNRAVAATRLAVSLITAMLLVGLAGCSDSSPSKINNDLATAPDPQTTNIGAALDIDNPKPA